MSDQVTPGGGYRPMPGEPTGAVPVLGAPPSTVVRAVQLMFAVAALSVVGLLLLFATQDELRAQIAASQPGVSASALDTAVTAATVGSVIFGLLVVGLYVFLALKVRAGRSWARITTLVLTALSVLATLATLGQPQPSLSRILSLITVVLSVGIVVLLMRRPSADYFRRRS